MRIGTSRVAARPDGVQGGRAARALAIGVAAALSLTLGCASLRARRADAVDIGTADQRVLEGCYDCLLEARDVYARVAAARDRTNAAVAVVRLFETELLLALREKELALDWRPAMQRARVLVPRLPATLEAGRLLLLVDAVFPDENGVSPKALAAMRRAKQGYVATVPAEQDWLAQAPLRPAVREYLGRSLDCAYPNPRGLRSEPYDSVKRRRQPAVGAPPLIHYQFGTCALGDSVSLQQARHAVPRFVETSYFLGQSAAYSADETGGDDARRLLDQAYARFPRAPGVTFFLGWLGTVTGDCEEAIRYYDLTIATEPAHEQAYVQRTICLTNLGQDSAAIESATRWIALETRSTGQGYYWRARNRLQRRELELARSDIEVAKHLTDSAVNALTLAGVIEYEQEDLVPSERDLRAARAKPNGQKVCTAAWYLGLIENKGSKWKAAATSFSDAMACYDERIAENRAAIRRVQRNARLRAAVKERRIAALEADIAELQRQYFAGAFNSATNSARAGDVARSRALLEVAALDARLSDQVARLRAALAALERDPPR